MSWRLPLAKPGSSTARISRWLQPSWRAALIWASSGAPASSPMPVRIISAPKRLGEILGRNRRHFFLEFRGGDEFVEFFLVGGAVQRQLDRLPDEAGIEQDVGQFDGVDSLLAG